jgi:site-specific recombinase XerD
MALTMIYSCGLRLSEGLHLRVADIDSERMSVRVRQGKGGKDRYVPLPARTWELLRNYLGSAHPQSWLFPSKNPKEPLSPTSLQKTFKMVVYQSRIDKNASVHTLRHSYATHLLEHGVSLRVIQEVLGHRSPHTTALYAHLTQKIMGSFTDTLDAVMAHL